MRRTIKDFRRRLEGINSELPDKFKMEVGRCNGGYILESNNGSKTENYHLSINEMYIFLDGYQRGLDVLNYSKENTND